MVNHEGDKEWLVKEILGAKWLRIGIERKKKALVKWIGFAEPTWEPVEELQETAACRCYKQQYGNLMENTGTLMVGKARR